MSNKVVILSDSTCDLGEELLKKYRTITRLKELSKEALKEDLPDKVAEDLYNFLKEYKKD